MNVVRTAGLLVGAMALSTFLATASPAAAADRRVETLAKDALKKAASDYLSMEYGRAVQRLERALAACRATRCSVATRALLLRDIGTMRFRNGDAEASRKVWAEALKLQPSLWLNPDYDAPDLRAAWQETKGGLTAPPSTGDFIHTPALEQRSDTPLPIYVESAPNATNVARVIVKYKSNSMGDWNRLELKRIGNGWGGQIRCADVTLGAMLYWVQGFDSGNDPVASSGDPKRPYTVPIKEEISTEPPHLPGESPPRSCTETSDCPPGLPGCGKANESSETDYTDEDSEKPIESRETKYAHLWIGASLAVDFVSVPSGDDLCKLSNNEPLNLANFYCTNPDGTDFPTRANPVENNNLVLGRNQSGHSDGGVGFGDVRPMLSVDYALSTNLLAGVRLGYVLNAYPGTAAVRDGRAFGLPLHFEARVTYLFGHRPLAHSGFAPMVFVGGGASEFDHHSDAFVYLQNSGWREVNIWLTDAPFFAALGAGLRYQFSQRTAFTAAARFNAVIGGNGFLPTFGPEVGVLYGF